MTKKVLEVNKAEAFMAELSELGLAGAVKFLNKISNGHRKVTPTGFPSLDKLLFPDSPGLAHGIDVEIASKTGSAGKTTLAAQIIANWQRAGKKVVYIDVENSMHDLTYFELLGVYTDPATCPAGIWPMGYIGHQFDEDGNVIEALTLEFVFDAIRSLSLSSVDLIVVDSVDALVQKSEAEKLADQNAKQGGISQKLSHFMRKNVAKRASIIWVNQMRQSMAFNPTGNVTYVTSGGRAMYYYAATRLELQNVAKLKEGDNEPHGFTSRIIAIKNKIGGNQWHSCELNYINGEGFSPTYDRLKWALASRLIIKSGAWFSSPQLGIKVQGEKRLYDMLRSNKDGCLDKLVAEMGDVTGEVSVANDADIEELSARQDV
jgi:RecA/RadA recombinase